MSYFKFNRKAALMKSFLKACVLAALSMTLGVALAHKAFAEERGGLSQIAAAKVCPGGAPTTEQFFDNLKPRKLTIRTLSASGQGKARVTYNLAAEKNRTPLLPPDAEFFYAIFDSMNTGIVTMTDGCVFPGSVVTIDNATFANFLNRAGVLENEMILAPFGTEA